MNRGRYVLGAKPPTLSGAYTFARKVRAIVERRGFVCWTRHLAREPGSTRFAVVFHARHPYGVDRSVTLVVVSGWWARMPGTGTPYSPNDCAEALFRKCRSRSAPLEEA